MNTKHWLLWDGDCGFCRKLVERLAQRDTMNCFTLIPYQEAPAPPMTPALRIQSARAVQVITRDGQRLSGGRAVLFALQRTDWRPRVIQVLLIHPFIWGVDAAYWFVARYRSHLDRFVPDP